jgi:hypothetical protein
MFKSSLLQVHSDKQFVKIYMALLRSATSHGLWTINISLLWSEELSLCKSLLELVVWFASTNHRYISKVEIAKTCLRSHISDTRKRKRNRVRIRIDQVES